MRTKTFASNVKSLWLFKVYIRLVVCGVCIFESITSPPLSLFPLHIPYKILSDSAVRISAVHILHPLWS